MIQLNAGHTHLHYNTETEAIEIQAHGYTGWRSSGYFILNNLEEFAGRIAEHIKTMHGDITKRTLVDTSDTLVVELCASTDFHGRREHFVYFVLAPSTIKHQSSVEELHDGLWSWISIPVKPEDLITDAEPITIKSTN